MAEIEETRAVIEAEETYDGKIIPTQQTDLDRPVRIHEGATVQGSVYGTSISMDSEATVQGSVMASEEVELSGGHVNGEVGTPGKVVSENARIEGTITGEKIRLKHCVVRGNVAGGDVILENSIVLGLATADQNLTIEDSLCYSFRGINEVHVDGALTILPQAVIQGEINLKSPVRVVGLDEIEIGGKSRLPEMTEADLHVDNGIKYLTLAPRILNLSKAEDRLVELEESIDDVVTNTIGETDSLSISNLLDMLTVDIKNISEKIGNKSNINE